MISNKEEISSVALLPAFLFIAACSGRVALQNGQGNISSIDKSSVISSSMGSSIQQKVVESQESGQARIGVMLPNGTTVQASGEVSAEFQGQNGWNNVAAQDKSSVISGSPNSVINQYTTNVYQGLSEDHLIALLKTRDKKISCLCENKNDCNSSLIHWLIINSNGDLS